MFRENAVYKRFMLLIFQASTRCFDVSPMDKKIPVALLEISNFRIDSRMSSLFQLMKLPSKSFKEHNIFLKHHIQSFPSISTKFFIYLRFEL